MSGCKFDYSRRKGLSHLRTAKPPRSLYRRDSACAMAERPRLATFSAYSSTDPSGNLNRFWTTEVSSRIRRPLTPKTEHSRCCCHCFSAKLQAVSSSTDNTATALTQYVLGTSGSDNDLCAYRCHSDLHARVSMLRQLSCQKLIQLSIEHPVGHELRDMTSQLKRFVQWISDKRLS